jgi:class 3 adenylate cyclase/tetratricopeptide (TPR) repeat protein
VVRTETVTVLFTDLVGSTELADRLGHAAYEMLRSAHFDALRAAVRAHNGTEVKTTGDGLMVSFASIGDAVRCAVAMQHAAEKQGRQARRNVLSPVEGPAATSSPASPSSSMVGAGVPACPPLQMRVGISVGEATRESNDLFGPPVVEAARLCAAAQPGQILAADVVRVLSRGLGQPFAAIGELTLKGIADPVAACEVGWEPLADETAIPLPPLLAAGQQFAFAGRQPELDGLLGMWQQAQDRVRRVALIAGEPGIGKTRLAAETAAMAHASGATVLYGRCDDELGVPFQPFVESLEYFVAHSPQDGLRARLGRHAGELVRLAPELAARIADLPPPLQSDAETERYRMFDAVAAWLAAAAAERPLVLILDDLHWAAKPTLLLLKHILRSGEFAKGRASGDGGTGVSPVRVHRPEAGATSGSNQPTCGAGPSMELGTGVSPSHLLILGTYRDTELDRTHPLSDLLADMRKDPMVKRVALRGLDIAGVETFLAGAAGRELDEAGRALARVVHAETEGNPFFVGEVLRHLGESGAVYQRDGCWVTDRNVEQLGIPEGVKEVIGRRLNRLSEAANLALSMAAVIGRDFDLGVLAALLPLPLGGGRGEGSPATEDAVIAALDEAVRARLVNETGIVDAYRFAHALVHETLYAEVSASRRVRLHRRIADAIAVRRPDDVVALAHHYQEAAVAGDVEKAIEYSMRAGDQARARLAYDQAVLYYRQALDLLGETGAGVPSRRDVARAQGSPSPETTFMGSVQGCELLIRLGEAQRDAGDASFRQTLLDAAHLAQRLGDSDRLARAALSNTRGYFSAAGMVDRDRVQVLEAALNAIDRTDSPTRARLQATLVAELTFSPDRARLLALDREVHALARRLGDQATLAHVLSSRYVAIWTPETLHERLATSAELISLAQQLGDPAQLWFACSWRLLACLSAGRIEEVDQQLVHLVEITSRLGRPNLRWYLTRYQSWRALLLGDSQQAEELAAKSFRIGDSTGQPDSDVIYASQLWAIRRAQGRLEELEARIPAASARQTSTIIFRAQAATVLHGVQRVKEARRLLESDADRAFAAVPRDVHWLPGITTYAQLCVELDAREAAGALYEQLLPCRGQIPYIHGTVNGDVAMYLGLLATTLGRYDDAEVHFVEAHAMHERIGAPYWLAVTRVDWAKMLRRRARPGDRERARAMLDQALATAREYGFGGVERQTMQLLAQRSD